MLRRIVLGLCVCSRAYYATATHHAADPIAGLCWKTVAEPGAPGRAMAHLRRARRYHQRFWHPVSNPGGIIEPTAIVRQARCGTGCAGWRHGLAGEKGHALGRRASSAQRSCGKDSASKIPWTMCDCGSMPRLWNPTSVWSNARSASDTATRERRRSGRYASRLHARVRRCPESRVAPAGSASHAPGQHGRNARPRHASRVARGTPTMMRIRDEVPSGIVSSLLRWVKAFCAPNATQQARRAAGGQRRMCAVAWMRLCVLAWGRDHPQGGPVLSVFTHRYRRPGKSQPMLDSLHRSARLWRGPMPGDIARRQAGQTCAHRNGR